MKKLCFTSDKFKPLPGEEEETNPGRYGKALAQWVKTKLTDKGYKFEQAAIPEDWGWLLMLKRKPFSIWVGCANEEGSTTRWCLFVEAEMGIVQKLFNKTDPRTEIKALESTLESVIAGQGFRDIKWEEMSSIDKP